MTQIAPLDLEKMSTVLFEKSHLLKDGEYVLLMNLAKSCRECEEKRDELASALEPHLHLFKQPWYETYKAKWAYSITLGIIGVGVIVWLFVTQYS